MQLSLGHKAKSPARSQHHQFRGDELLQAVTAAFGYYGLCGDIAGQASGKPGSFFTEFLDALYSAGENEIMAAVRINRIDGPL